MGIAVAAVVATSGWAAEPELRRSGFLGLQVTAAPAGRGVLVQGLAPGGSAGDAGIGKDDVITRLDGKDVPGPDEFVRAARRLKAGDIAVATVQRGGTPMEVRVPVKPRPTEATPAGIDVRYEAVAVDKHLRRTILTLPAAAGRHPAVLFVTGIGCFSQEIVGPPDSVGQLLRGLTRAGFATMRVEKSGMGDSEGPPCASPEADFHAELRGYVAGLRALKRHPRVDAENVFIVGLSIGGVHAPLIEKEEPVKGSVVINTAAKPFMEYLLETRRRQMTLGGMAPDAIDEAMLRNELCTHRVLVERQHPDAVIAARPDCREEIAFPAPHTYMQQWAALNMARAWKDSRAPLLVVIGQSDFVATVSESPYLVDMVNRFQPGRAQLAAIDGMDHYMTRAASMAESMRREGNGEFEPRVLQVTADWLRGHVKKGA